MSLISLLVGSHFRPPASLLLTVLPTGTPFLLERDDFNEYDAAALKVMLNPADIPQEQHPQLEAELPSYGRELAELLCGDAIFLGFIAASNGTPLAKARAKGMSYLVGNCEFRAASATSGCLLFGPSGEFLVKSENS